MKSCFVTVGDDLNVFAATSVKDFPRTSLESLITQAALSQTVGMTRPTTDHNSWVSIWLTLHLFSMQPQFHSEVCFIYKWPAS